MFKISKKRTDKKKVLKSLKMDFDDIVF